MYMNIKKSTSSKSRKNEHSDEMCLVMAASVDPPRIFKAVKEECKPVATKINQDAIYSKEDIKFINEEVNKLLNKGIIEPFKSSWKAQVL